MLMTTNIKEIKFTNLIIKYNEDFFNEQTRRKIRHVRNQTIFAHTLFTIITSTISLLLIAYLFLRMFIRQQLSIVDISLILLNIVTVVNQILNTYKAMPRLQDKAVIRAEVPQYYRLIELAESADLLHINNEGLGEVFISRNGKKEFLPLIFFEVECLGENVTTYEQRETSEGLLVEIDCTRKDFIYLAFKDGPKEQEIDKENYIFASRREFRSLNMLDDFMRDIEQEIATKEKDLAKQNAENQEMNG